jgi:hypothetical protein
MPDDSSNRESATADSREATRHPRADGAHLVVAARDFLGGSTPPDSGPLGAPDLARQKENLRQWAGSLGLLLAPAQLPAKVVRGGMEHDLFHDEAGDRYFKVTRHGVFGLSPGIELALVSSSQDPRRFHLWEATPLEYLDRLALLNELVPDLNHLEGTIVQPDGDMAIVTSQPRFDLVPVAQPEIDAWFAALGFEPVTAAAFYRAADNLGVFDAHDKNVVRAGDTLIPFDVIPCHPAGGFLRFIADALAAGHTLRTVRTATTH